MTHSIEALQARVVGTGGDAQRGGVEALVDDAVALQTELSVQRDELASSYRRLQEMEDHYRRLFEVAPTGFVRISKTQRIEEANLVARLLLGIDARTSLLGSRLVTSYIAASSLRAWNDLLGRDEGTARLSIYGVHGPIVADVRTVPWHEPDGGWLVMIDDVTELSEARARQALAEARFAQVVERMSDGLVLVNVMTGLIASHNEGFAALVGRSRESLVGVLHESLFAAAVRGVQTALLRQAHDGARRSVRLRYGHPDGDRMTEATLGLVEEGSETFEVLLVRDVTDKLRAEAERREVESRLIETQKLEALGLLAAGIAHDMNNLLAAVLTSAEVPPTEESMADLRAAALRGRDLTERLLAVSRRKPLRQEAFDLLAVAEEVVTLARHTFRREITIVFERPKESWSLEGDPGQWHQALLNLLINARDAIPESGTITISAEHRGDSYALVVRDTGAGMPEDVARRAFEPFFTTKGEGKGTGLGLAHVRAVVAAHGGATTIDSTPGKGTAIRLEVKVSHGPVEAAAPPAKLTQTPPRSGLRALVVDDEETIARAAKRLLERGDFCVTSVTSAREALALLEREAFDVVLTDRSMPEMNGEQLCREVSARWPLVPLVVMTGLADDADIKMLRGLGVRAVVHKPFRRDELFAALRAVTTVKGGSPQPM